MMGLAAFQVTSGTIRMDSFFSVENPAKCNNLCWWTLWTDATMPTAKLRNFYCNLFGTHNSGDNYFLILNSVLATARAGSLARWGDLHPETAELLNTRESWYLRPIWPAGWYVQQTSVFIHWYPIYPVHYLEFSASAYNIALDSCSGPILRCDGSVIGKRTAATHLGLMYNKI